MKAKQLVNKKWVPLEVKVTKKLKNGDGKFFDMKQQKLKKKVHGKWVDNY